jgi:hypothetical protein
MPEVSAVRPAQARKATTDLARPGYSTAYWSRSAWVVVVMLVLCSANQARNLAVATIVARPR